MKKILPLIVLACFLNSCQKTEITFENPKIIPEPSSIAMNKGAFKLDNSIGIAFDETFKVSADYLKSYIEDGSKFKLGKNSSINFIKDETIDNPEGYSLQISTKSIDIKAKTDQGAFYAVQSLRQLLPVGFENGTFSEYHVLLPCLTIQDSPQFKYRGMHLDVGRHMVSVEFIKKYIDALAMLKMNNFHWHLTEDQGWRIEIKKYPKLQEIAAYRSETLIGHYNTTPQQFDGKRYGGFYTQDQVKDIVAYALQRHVNIIPEIEMPGHAQAAIAAYPELGCSGEHVEVATKWGVFEDIYCSKDETFNFLEDVLDEVLALFPSEYIHIGGDEAPKTKWKTCKVCQKRIKDEGLKDEHELQSYFITRIEKYLNGKGRQIIGWDEILEGGLAPNATIMSWRGTEGAIEAAKQKHNVILTPSSHCYFDYYQSDNEDEPLAIGGFLPLEKVYGFNPIPEEISNEYSQFVLGAQGNVWTEYMTTEPHIEYMVFPRIIAMSEVLWSKPENKNYDDFIVRLEKLNERLDVLNIHYANHLYEVKGELVSNAYQLKTTTKTHSIRYTLDGSEVTINSEIYSNPIPITNNATLNAAVFNDTKQLGKTFTRTFNHHKAFGAKISMNVEPSPAYTGSGKEGLINGISGSDKRYGDKEWLGFLGEDLIITIDLDQETQINSISTRFYNAQGQRIYAPQMVEASFGDENTEKSTLKIPESDKSLVDVTLEANIKTKHIVLKIPNYGMVPEGRQGVGNKTYTFIDEIIIN